MRKAYILDNDDGDKLQIIELGENVMLSIERGDHKLGMVLSHNQWLDLMEIRYRLNFAVPNEAEEL